MRKWILWTGLTFITLGIIGFAGFARLDHAGAAQSVQAVQADAPSPIAQPDTSRQVAAKLNCADFKPANRGESGLVIDAGVCRMNGIKYAINTFVSEDVRDTWLKDAEPLGVVPAFESANSVVYKSIG